MSSYTKLALAVAALVLAVATFWVFFPGEDRLPIIVENGSISVTAPGLSWDRHGTDRSYEQVHPGGKHVRSFTATSGNCSVAGDTITLLLNNPVAERVIIRRHGLHLPPFFKGHADVVFEAEGNLSVVPATVNLATLFGVTRFQDETGNTCNVTAGVVEIGQVH